MLKVPSKFLARLREPIDWSDLHYAYENQLVGGQVVIDHACRILSESGSDNDDLLAIASARETDELKPLIDRVVGSLAHSNEHSLKWALILAAFIREADVPDKLEGIEDIYSSFGYPEELAQFVRYMPMHGPDLGSKEANENRMLESLRILAAEIVASE